MRLRTGPHLALKGNGNMCIHFSNFMEPTIPCRCSPLTTSIAHQQRKLCDLPSAQALLLSLIRRASQVVEKPQTFSLSLPDMEIEYWCTSNPFLSSKGLQEHEHF